jgi:hypothetical protein
VAVGLAAGDKAPIVSMLSTTEFTNMCIAAWPAGPAEFMTRNKRLGGERKQPLPAGKDLLTRAGGVVLSHRPSQAPRRGGGRRTTGEARAPAWQLERGLAFGEQLEGKEALALA